MNCNPPGPLSMGFPRKEYWSRLPFPPLGALPEMEPMSLATPALVSRFFTTAPLGKLFPSEQKYLWPFLSTSFFLVFILVRWWDALGLWVSSVQFSCSVLSNSLQPHGLQHARPPCPSPILSLLKLTSIESVTPSNHLILCHPLLLPPSVFPSIRVFSNESVLHIRWPKYWSFSFSISPSNEYSELISFRMDWLDLLAVQGTLKSLLQHHSSKASILWRSAFFIV